MISNSLTASSLIVDSFANIEPTEPMGRFKTMLVMRLARLGIRLEMMDNGNPLSIEDSSDIGLRAKYHALQCLQSATVNTLATL